jgi:hypothetical protein
MAPQRVILIRHAEKPGGAWPGPGLTEKGEEDKESLVIGGWQCAGALALFFRAPPSPLARPQRIYASHRDKPDGSKSRRPVQTVTALSQLLRLELVTDFTKGQETALAHALASLSGDILVCWQHESIPAIVAAIAGKNVGAPGSWASERFDLVWTLTRNGAAEAWRFQQSLQSLLPGDLTSLPGG